MTFDPADEISNNEAIKIIREIVLDGTIVISGHAKKRMAERGYSVHDVQYILTNGEIAKKKFNVKSRNWIYTVRGEDLEGDCGGVVTAIIGRMSAVIITALG
ncbi:conserved hypothetical protein [Candidatus Desulfarcum epimagneticum]|uniref:DUF4258 domain-containing protein n=1 Tax=uncultured Desulfobacteraceae bacterium TaxID=218296 RepID=A0A484HGS4_9BACT|nr:conserved hypothetical protein [uncultured Desulfobacteraceae bacterium]